MTPGALVAGKYRLRRLIGEGAVGEVWAATNETTEREVALKLILGADKELRERALREARACGRISHRNVVEILDAGETDGGTPFLVMQLLSGETVADRLRRERRLHPPKAAAIALDAARGLAAAHAAGIIHRDLKPTNIYLHREPDTGWDTVKLVDFGVSKMLRSKGPPTTKTGDLVGSPAYMSPEQARAERTLDHRTDIWSLGLVLFEMLTGDRPFPSRDINVITEIVRHPIPDVASLVPHVDARLSAVVARCLERDLNRRIGSAAELIALLQPCAAGEDVWGGSDSRRHSHAATAGPPSGSQTAPLPLAPHAEPDEDQIPTVAVGPPAKGPAPSPASQPFRPVPTTIVDRSRAPQAISADRRPAQAAQLGPLVHAPSAPYGASPVGANAAGYRPPMETEDDFDRAPTAQRPPTPREPAPSVAHSAVASPRASGPAMYLPAPTGGPHSAAEAPPPRRLLRKGDGTLFLVGVTSMLTILALVGLALGLNYFLRSGKGGDGAASAPGGATPTASAEEGRP